MLVEIANLLKDQPELLWSFYVLIEHVALNKPCLLLKVQK
jgi:hypothetical protein